MQYDTIEYKNKTIEIHFDEDPMNPREWDNLGTMVCFHKRYNLGDKHNFDDPNDIIAFIKRNDVIALPLYLYDHSGITINTSGFSCPWDSGQVGFIYVTKEKVKQEYKWNRITQSRLEKIHKYLKNEVETYDQYITGDVYWYSAGDDCCSGFYGTDFENNGLLDYARNAIDYQIAEEQKLKMENL